jgi:hypothetical protein
MEPPIAKALPLVAELAAVPERRVLAAPLSAGWKPALRIVMIMDAHTDTKG